MVNHWSDERQRNRENWSRPFGLRHKFGHISLPASTVGPATAFCSSPRLAEFSLATPSVPIV